MTKQGVLLKMHGKLGDEVSYYLPLGPDIINMNELLGEPIELEYQGVIHCIRCGRVTRKSFAQGFCYPCFTRAPETSECILRPELCRAQDGESRDMKWSEEHCLQDHFVYLAISSGLKVGVTRSSQVPTRWIDQGAWKAIRLAKTPNRFLAGQIEVEVGGHARVADDLIVAVPLSLVLARGRDVEEGAVADVTGHGHKRWIEHRRHLTERGL